jgi:sigma-B regulation protein RsbU (phosphoserine phosphatase)
VIAELRASYPASQIKAHFELTQKVDCDGGRIAQLFSNLLGNALTHGTPGTPVRIQGTAKGGEFELSVAHLGGPSAQETRFTFRMPLR